MLTALCRLETAEISAEILRKSHIGKCLSQIAETHPIEDVKEKALVVISQWKSRLKKAVTASTKNQGSAP